MFPLPSADAIPSLDRALQRRAGSIPEVRALFRPARHAVGAVHGELGFFGMRLTLACLPRDLRCLGGSVAPYSAALTFPISRALVLFSGPTRGDDFGLVGSRLRLRLDGLGLVPENFSGATPIAVCAYYRICWSEPDTR